MDIIKSEWMWSTKQQLHLHQLTKAFLSIVGFKRMQVPNDSLIALSIKWSGRRMISYRALSNDKPLNKTGDSSAQVKSCWRGLSDNKLSKSEKQYALFTDSFLLPCCRKALEVEVIYMESSTTSLETAEKEGKMKSVCRGESYPPGFRHCWRRKMANTLSRYWPQGDAMYR